MCYESSQYTQVGKGYRSKEHKSLAVSDKGFFWHSNETGGKTALDYLMAVRNYDFVSAVCHLINESPYEKGASSNRKKQVRSPPKSKQAQSTTTTPKHHKQKSETQPKPQNIILPRRNKDNYNVIAYLQNRGIDRDIIMDCINRGVLYESALHKNAVFLGKDENGKTRFAAMRGTTGDFKCDAEGSDKSYGFVIPSNNPDSQSVMIFESPIDCLSHQTMCKRGDIPDFDGWRLSLGGTSGIALIGFLARYPNINHCIIATDNDKAGNSFADRLAQKITLANERVHPLHGIDWNDACLLALQATRGLQRGEHANEQAKPDTSLY